jgi:hypothetical protein
MAKPAFKMMALGTLLLAGAVAGTLTVGSPAVLRPCIRADRVDQLGPRIAATFNTRQTLTVHRGKIVTLELMTDASADWPWREPTSSNDSVLAAESLCTYPERITTLPDEWFPFRAAATGSATITAPAEPDTSNYHTVVITVNVVP